MSSFRKLITGVTIARRKQKGPQDVKGSPRPTSEKPAHSNDDTLVARDQNEARMSSEKNSQKSRNAYAAPDEGLEARRREEYEQDPLKGNYGDVPSDASRDLEPIKAVASHDIGDIVRFRARIHQSRPLGPKIMFLVFRHTITTVQGILTEEEGAVSQNMIHWAERLHRETIVVVEGIVQEPKDGQEEVKGTTIHRVEVKIRKLYVVAEPTTILPFQVIDVQRSAEAYEKEGAQFTRVGDRTRFNNRVLDLRTATSQSIFRIHSGMTRLFREFLDGQQFMEINSSKIQGSATESGAAVFRLDYFRRPAFLSQSPQLAKQMCIAADMERVYEIGPVFRAENSNTHRHLTEFTGLDLEMTFNADYSEVIDTIDSLLLHIFRGVQSQYREEIEAVKFQFPHDNLVIPETTLRLRFQEAVKLLRDSGWKEEDGTEPGDFRDLSTSGEQRLGQLIKEKYNTDYYILDKFPLDVRPFYTMPDPEDNRLSNSFDFFLRGEEILSGGQRIHHAHQLEERMREIGIQPDSMKEYVDGFRWGCPPHGGGGIGLERLVMLFLNLRDIRWANLFPRDPKSFMQTDTDLREAAAQVSQSIVLHGPTAKTTRDKHNDELPPLSDLIAKYGDATNTTWVDPSWTVWRHKPTGAAVAYMPDGEYAVTFGNPLCESDQIATVIRAYLNYIKDEHLKPVWCCVDKETEQYLAHNLGWSAVIAVAEERLNPTEVNLEEDRNMRRKIHRAEREGVKLNEVSGTPNEEFQKKVAERLRDWQEDRKGAQVHLTGLRPFDDMSHRRYFYATDKDEKIYCLVVLAQLAAQHGFQIKWALEFPGAPGGAIEYILSDVIRKVGDAGVQSATFGAGATKTLERADNVGGFRFMILEKAYSGLAKAFSLGGKGDFRSKFGVEQDPLYICYPKGSIGIRGINTIMSVLQKPK